MKRMTCLILAALVVIALGASPTRPAFADSSGRARTVTSADINASLTPPGGIKAAQTGGNTVGDVIRENEPRADGYRHIDTPATIRALQRLGVNTYVYLIWNSPTDWSDLVNEFAPAAERANIRIWLYLVPPSECLDSPVKHLSGRCSRPFKTDYVKWAEEIAQLSVQHPNVVAWALDDFFSQLPPEEVTEMQRVQDSINPNLGFYTTVYYGDAIRGEFYDRYEGLIDGIIYPYTGANSNTQDATHVGPNLDAILEQTEPRGLGVVLLAYTGRYLSAIVPPTDRYIADVITEAEPYMESGRIMGITLYGLPIAGGDGITAANMAHTGTGWLSMAASIFARTEIGYSAQAQQRIIVDQRAKSFGLEFSDYDVYFDQNNTTTSYHTRQVLIDGKVVWESDAPGGGGAWHHHYIDLGDTLRGKRTATLTLRVIDKSSLSIWTNILIDDVVGHGFRVRNGGFETNAGWKLSKNSDAILPDVYHHADFVPDNALRAARAAFRGVPYRPRHNSGKGQPMDAMYGTGRLRFDVEEFSETPDAACAGASQVLTVDPGSPRYEVDFFQTSAHAPYPGFSGAHRLTVEIDGEPVWTRDANSVYPFWENGNGLQGPIDVSDFVQGKTTVTLAFRLCGVPHEDRRPNPAIDIGFDNLRTVGLRGSNFGFEAPGGWSFSSDSPGLGVDIDNPSIRPEAPAVTVSTGRVVGRAGTSAPTQIVITNSSAEALSGQISATVPQGWSVEPAQLAFGPIPAGGTVAVALTVDIPAEASEGSYWMIITASTPRGEAKQAQRLQVITDSIEFTPGTAAEVPWLVAPGGSQLDGEIFDGHGRFADGTTSFTYRLDLPSDVTGGDLTLHIGNEFLVSVSSDGTTWRTVLKEDREIHDLSNLQDRTLDIAELRDGDDPIYLRIADNKPDDGWGGWLGHLKVTMTP